MMIRYLHNLLRAYQYHLGLRGRRMAREILLQKSDRELEDMGFSRALLVAGTRHWPWRLEDELDADDVTSAEREEAINALRAMNDRDLLDLGITRGTIEESVRYGRASADRGVVESAASAVVEQADTQREPGAAQCYETDRKVA